MAIGARELAQHKAIVAKLSAIEALAGMTILCSDKTGTLTKNKLTLDTPVVFTGTEQDVIFAAALAAKREGQDAIDLCLTNSVPRLDVLHAHRHVQFIPFDPVSKRTEAVIEPPDGAARFKVSKGAPQVILALAHNAFEIQYRVEEVVNDFASKGYRALGVARTNANEQWDFLGLIPLFDPPRDDTKATIDRAIEMGVEVKMITGDQLAIAKETARRLGMGTNMYTTEVLTKEPSEERLQELAEHADGFAQVFPEHKFQIVELIQKRGHLCGMTGDGVNDAPALKKADIGVAVEGATDAAKAAADIVLVEPGLSVIITAMVKAREIFLRMKSYVIYRIACTLTLLLFMFFAQLLLTERERYFDATESIWAGFPYDPRSFRDLNLPLNVSTATSTAITSMFGGSLMPSKFSLPAIVLVILVILNDGTIVSIAYDYVVASRFPQKWALPSTILVCVVLGFIGLFEILILYFLLALNNQTLNLVSPLEERFSNGAVVPNSPNFPLSQGQIKSLIFFALSLGGQSTVFAARTRSFFFSRRPGKLLASAYLFAQIVSLILSLVWPLGGGLEPVALRTFSSCYGVEPGFFVARNVSVNIAGGGLSAYTPDSLANGSTVPVAALSYAMGQCQACSAGPNCFLYSTPNAWAVGFVIFYCILWFFAMDTIKVLVYRVIDKFSTDTEVPRHPPSVNAPPQASRIEQRKREKRLSVASYGERRATYVTRQGQAAHRTPLPANLPEVRCANEWTDLLARCAHDRAHRLARKRNRAAAAADDAVHLRPAAGPLRTVDARF